MNISSESNHEESKLLENENFSKRKPSACSKNSEIIHVSPGNNCRSKIIKNRFQVRFDP